MDSSEAERVAKYLIRHVLNRRSTELPSVVVSTVVLGRPPSFSTGAPQLYSAWYNVDKAVARANGFRMCD